MGQNKYVKTAAIFLGLIIFALGLVLVLSSQQEITGKNYVGYGEECSRIQVLCVQGYERFDDEKGCGCRRIQTGTVYCRPEQRGAAACITLYKPVCGWFDPAKVQCRNMTCAKTYSNSCFACADDEVLYYTEGECPQ